MKSSRKEPEKPLLCSSLFLLCSSSGSRKWKQKKNPRSKSSGERTSASRKQEEKRSLGYFRMLWCCFALSSFSLTDGTGESLIKVVEEEAEVGIVTRERDEANEASSWGLYWPKKPPCNIIEHSLHKDCLTCVPNGCVVCRFGHSAYRDRLRYTRKKLFLESGWSVL